MADFVLNRFDFNVDRLEVYELLMYHDVVEIEAGDTPLSPNRSSSDKVERERRVVEILKNKLPSPLNEKFANLFNEFDEQRTAEAKLAKAIDALDSIIHEMDYKEDWKGWTKEFLVDKKLKYFEEFPQLKEIFYEILEFLESNGYFDG